MSFSPGGSGGGGGSIAGSGDVALSNVNNGEFLRYDSSVGKWRNAGSDATLISVNSQSGTNYTLTLGDAGAVIETTSGSPVTVTVPPSSSVALAVGTTVAIRQYGTGQLSVLAATGVTIRSRGSAYKLGGQYAEAILTKRATDEWILSGDLTT